MLHLPARLWAALAIGAALALSALAHVPALAGGFTNWDDPGFLLSNPLTVDPLGGGVLALLRTADQAYAIPVTTLVYAAQRALFGLDPAAFHAVSLGLHLLAVALAAILAQRMGRGDDDGRRATGWLAAAVAAAVFGVHPLTVEPVAWVVGQKDLLATVLLLAALIIRCGPPGARASDSAGRSAAVLLLISLSLAAKPSAVAAPLLLLAVDAALGRPVRRRGAIAV
ncbi:MAG: hypothetical protein AAGC55_20460, partial [Myxococcota bacterium]